MDKVTEAPPPMDNNKRNRGKNGNENGSQTPSKRSSSRGSCAPLSDGPSVAFPGASSRDLARSVGGFVGGVLPFVRLGASRTFSLGSESDLRLVSSQRTA